MAIGFVKKTLLRKIFCAGAFVAAASLCTGSALASEYIPGILTPSFVDEIRIGVHHHDLHIAGVQDEHGVDINAEILFRRPNIYYENPLLLFLFNPRFHIGGHLNTSGDTSQAYVGATYDYRLTERFFVEASFGGVIHDGDLKPTAVPGAVRPLGCRVMFRESASAGYQFNENLRVMITFDHINNFNLCSNNAGLSTIGGRIGYKF